MKSILKWMLKYTSSRWYTALVSLMAGLDPFIVVVPTDALAITATMGKPRRWALIALCIGIGSTAGCVMLSYLLQNYGEMTLQMLGIELSTSQFWLDAREWILAYAMWAIIFFAIGPLPLQPAIVLAALGGMPLVQIGLASLIGRCSKYLFLCWITSHAPRVLDRLWGLETELEALKKVQSTSDEPRS